MRIAQSTDHVHRLTQKGTTMKCMTIYYRICRILLTVSVPGFAQDPGWPRKLEKPGGTVIVYQPQVDEWKDYTDITWRQAFQMTPTGGKQVIGAATFDGKDKRRQGQAHGRHLSGSRSLILTFRHSMRPHPQRWINSSRPLFRKSSTSLLSVSSPTCPSRNPSRR